MLKKKKKRNAEHYFLILEGWRISNNELINDKYLYIWQR